MPNIFKSFLKPAVDQYVFKDVDDIIIEPPPPPPEENPPEPPRELTPEESEEKANADSVISFAKVQADEILADARRAKAIARATPKGCARLRWKERPTFSRSWRTRPPG